MTEIAPHQSRLLGTVPDVVHGITHRVIGMGLADGNLGYSAPRDRDDAWEMRRRWCAALGVDAERLVTLGQVHGAAVVRVSATDAGRGSRPGSAQLGLADALVTDEPGVALMTLHADCLPILIVDPDTPAVAVAHAGWRGTVADVAGATVRAMMASYGSRPERLLVHLGPAIGPCCYEVGADVVGAWSDEAGGAAESTIARDNGRTTFDLSQANRLLLQRAGVLPTSIEVGDVCTRCAGDTWFSHRGQGPLTGRFGAIIALVGRTP